MRAQRDGFRFIYAWTVNSLTNQDEYLRIGVDGMVTDYPGFLVDLVRDTFSSSIRLATRSDNPFMPPDAVYALSVKTGNDGTDAHITYTLPRRVRLCEHNRQHKLDRQDGKRTNESRCAAVPRPWEIEKHLREK